MEPSGDLPREFAPKIVLPEDVESQQRPSFLQKLFNKLTMREPPGSAVASSAAEQVNWPRAVQGMRRAADASMQSLCAQAAECVLTS